ncbi:MAG: NAD-dependent deacylase [Balneolaceae bacterium]|nr:MAG: NAD-dependent deacylase [Balneolaceae bacterium]
MKKLVVLTGAGISAESGLKTFRDSGGLWEGFSIEEVATIDAWYANPERVNEFYNFRRAEAANSIPNAGHLALKELESFFNVIIITQNVDDLHEKAGSSNVIHLHGMLRQARSESDPDLITDIGDAPILTGDKAADGSRLRPNIVWFGEAVPMMETAAKIVSEADLFIVTGTSLAVYPAAGLIHFAKEGIPKYIVDPKKPEIYLDDEWDHIIDTAASGLPELAGKLLNNHS